MTLVSVVIPTYNAALFLPETLDSVLNQSYSDLEIIVVDDGSSDHTVYLLERYCQVNPRIRMLQQHNQGVAAARNLGLSVAKGKFIALLDADDLWYPQKIETQLHQMTQNPSIGLVYCWSRLIDEQSRWNGGYIAFEFSGYVQAAIAYFNFIGHGSAPLIRREVFEELGCFDTTLHQQQAQGCEDWELYCRIAQKYSFGVVPAFLVGYRQQGASMSSNLAPMLKSYDLVQTRYLSSDFAQTYRRYSRGLFLLHLATLKSGQNQRGIALRLLWTALRYDTALLVNLQWYRTLLRNFNFSLGLSPFKQFLKQLWGYNSQDIPLVNCKFSELECVFDQKIKKVWFHRILFRRTRQLQSFFASNQGIRQSEPSISCFVDNADSFEVSTPHS